MEGLKGNKSIIIKIIATLYILTFIGCVIKCFKQGMVTIDIVALLALFIGIDLWRLKNWARLCAIFISSLVAVGIIAIFTMLIIEQIQPKISVLGIEQTPGTTGYCLVIIGLLVYFLFSLFQIGYFNLSRVKRLFIS